MGRFTLYRYRVTNPVPSQRLEKIFEIRYRKIHPQVCKSKDECQEFCEFMSHETQLKSLTRRLRLRFLLPKMIHHLNFLRSLDLD